MENIQTITSPIKIKQPVSQAPDGKLGLPLDKIVALLIPLLIFLTPLFFLPFTPNFYAFNKIYLVLGGSLLILGLFLIKGLMSKKISFFCSLLDAPVILFLLAFLASTLFVSPNRVLPFLGKTGIVLTLTFFYFALVQSRKSRESGRVWLQALMASSFVLSWISIFAFTRLLPKILPWDFVNSQAFTPAGSLTAFVSFQALVLPLILIFGLKSNQLLNKILYFLTAAICLVSLVLTASLMLPGKPAFPSLLSPTIGWWIAVEIFKNAKSAFLGVGPEGFLSAFSRFRPVTFNNSKVWNLRFAASSNEYLQLLTTTGLFGLLSIFYILLIAGKNLYRDLKQDGFNLGLKAVFIVSILLFLIIPANFLSLFVFYLLLALVAKQMASKKTLLVAQPIKLGLGFGLAVLLLIAYFAGRGWLAEATFKKALDAAAANKGLETYNQQIKAIKLNPFQEKYRLSYSQVNLALANSLASKKDLSDPDRQNITQLVSQAIAEAKSATALNPQNPIYWENLASLYRSLINFASGADNWAISAYVQAVRLDPTNPRLRIDLGGLLYGLGNYEAAIDQFKRAIDLKPDLPNAYYNLSWAYQQKEEYRQAFLSMQRVLALVPQDTQDFVKASQELEQLRDLLPDEEKLATAAAQKKEEVLKPPPPLPSPPPAAPINLPEESGPQLPSPSPESSPAATLSPTPTP